MDLPLLELLAQFGLAGIMTGILLVWKRADDLKHAAELIRIIDRQQLIEEKMQSIMIEQTRVLEGVRSSVEQLEQLSKIEEQLRSLHVK